MSHVLVDLEALSLPQRKRLMAHAARHWPELHDFIATSQLDPVQERREHGYYLRGMSIMVDPEVIGLPEDSRQLRLVA
jgi:hypothetical protein